MNPTIFKHLSRCPLAGDEHTPGKARHDWLGDKSLDQLDDYVKSETVRWAKVIKNANLAGTQ